MRSALEASLLFVLKAVGLPAPVEQLHFDWCCEHYKYRHHRSRNGNPPFCNACAVLDDLGVPYWPSSADHDYRRGRAFRFDFAWPDRKLAVEVDGGTFTGGRHVRGAGYERDVEKQNLAVTQGWRVLHFTQRQVTSGYALNVVEQALKQ